MLSDNINSNAEITLQSTILSFALLISSTKSHTWYDFFPQKTVLNGTHYIPTLNDLMLMYQPSSIFPRIYLVPKAKYFLPIPVKSSNILWSIKLLLFILYACIVILVFDSNFHVPIAVLISSYHFVSFIGALSSICCHYSA